MGNRGAEDSSDKLQRKLAKVERKRKQLRWLCTVQVLLAVPYGVYVLTPPWKPEEASTGQERSVIVYYQVHARTHPQPSPGLTLTAKPTSPPCARRRRSPCSGHSSACWACSLRPCEGFSR